MIARKLHGLFRNSILILSIYGCGENPQGAKNVVVFVDVSGSVRDFDVYREAWKRISASLKPGDRILLARITHETFTAFRPVLDKEIPPFNALTDNKMKYDRQVKAIREEISAGLDKAIEGPRSPKTDIMNTLAIAEKIFAGDPRGRVLVLLSDMLEDSDDYNFERIAVNDEFVKRVIEKNRKLGRLPDLGGAAVHVAGASAQTAGRAHDVQRFWLEYVKAANGRLRPQDYEPALTHFTE
jgi:hypothetical protein